MQLDEQQKAAVFTDAINVLCLSGAGSGKTRILVERIAHLVENCKVSSYEIMCCSFTRKASRELRTRIEERIGQEAAQKITMGTIHAVALRFLKRFGELVGLKGRSLTVYSEFEEKYLLREVAIDMGIYDGKKWKISKRDVDAVFEKYYQEGVEPAEDQAAKPLFHEFINRCRENNSITYGGLLVGFRLLMPKIQQYLRFRHIFIDEVQDIDTLQWLVFRELQAIFGAALFTVGDLDQSIYEWRGARPDYLIDHQSEFTIYKIESNYRSCPEIVAAANRLIENNVGRIPRTMRATRGDRGAMNVERGMDSSESAKAIYWAITRKVPGKDIAVLWRNHFLLKKLSSHLDTLNVPHTYIGRSTELMDSQAFRQFHAFLKLLVNPFDNFSFLVLRDILGLSRAEYNAIRLRATQESKSHFQAWMHVDDEDRIIPENLVESEKLKAVRRVWFELAGSEWRFHEAVGNLMVPEMNLPEGVEKVKEFVDEWLLDNPEGTAADYLDWLATFDLQDEIEEGDDKLKLMTVHSAKGLEWPLVMLIGCNEGIIPSKQAVDSGEIEQERRLFYVACTRAKDSLILAVRPERKEDERGKVYFNPVSRFVREAIL